MFKYKKIVLSFSVIIYVLLTIVELIKYLICDNTLYGAYYLLVCLLIIFLMIPCAYNYKKYYSLARISKLILIVVLGILNSFVLEHIVLNSMNYMDSSNDYIKMIFIYKSVFKPIIYFIIAVVCGLEFKNEKVI